MRNLIGSELTSDCASLGKITTEGGGTGSGAGRAAI